MRLGDVGWCCASIGDIACGGYSGSGDGCWCCRWWWYVVVGIGVDRRSRRIMRCFVSLLVVVLGL